MKKLSQKNIGLVLIGVSVILIILLVFLKIEVEAQEAFLCEAVHESPDIGIQECPAHESNTSWLILLAFGISIIILVIGAYLAFVPEAKEAKKIKKIDTSKLSEGEKKIYELLRHNEGSMYQSDIIKETGLSKVKVTRILDKLAGKGLIDRQRRGMTNIIILK